MQDRNLSMKTFELLKSLVSFPRQDVYEIMFLVTGSSPTELGMIL